MHQEILPVLLSNNFMYNPITATTYVNRIGQYPYAGNSATTNDSQLPRSHNPYQFHTYTQPSNQTLFHNTNQIHNIDPASLQLLKQNLLKPPNNPYNGEPQLFQTFINQLNSIIKGIPLEPWDLINILEARTTGKPQKIIQGHMNYGSRDPQTALNNINKELVERFGSGARVAINLTSKIDAFQPIKDVHQIDKLEELLDLCKAIRSNLPYLPELQEFNFSNGIAKIWVKLPYAFQTSWMSTSCDYKSQNGDRHPPFDLFVNFLNKKFKEYSDPAYERKPFEGNKRAREHKTYKTNIPKEEESLLSETKEPCLLHSTSQHKLHECKLFKKYNDQEKFDFMKENGLCFKCLGKHLRISCKESPKCEKCSKKHLTVLHRDNFPTKSDAKNERSMEQSNNDGTPTSLCTRVCGNRKLQLSCSKTLLVDVTWPGNSKKTLRCYAIVDEQSSSSFADPKLADFFGIQAPKTEYVLTTLSGLRTTTRGIQVQGLKVKGVGEGKGFKLPTLFTNDAIPDNKDEVASPSIVRAHAHIAHYAKFFNEVDVNADTLLLIGRDSSDGIFTTRHGHKAPYVHHTRLGWALVGNICTSATNTTEKKVLRTKLDHEHYHSEICFPSIKTTDQKCLKNDPFDQHPDDELLGLSQDEQRFMDIVLNGIHINDEGNITLPLPFKNEDTKFPDNRQSILNRTRNTLNRIKRDNVKLNKCLSAMQDHLNSKHVEVVPKEDQTKCNKELWYIPVFPIAHSKKTNVRLVFDSSATFQGTSLNGTLLSGPDFNNRLRSVLLRFRMEDVAISADIAAMFYNFHLEPKDRDKTRFFWFRENNPEKELVEYRARVHLFGNTSSPALAIIGLRFAVNNDSTNASQEVKQFIKNNFYVDDGLKSTKTPQEAIAILSQTKEALSKFNIRLHKISSNSMEVTNSFPTSELSESPPELSGQSMQPTLGLKWETDKDLLAIQMNVPDHPFTRRGILATVNSIFDPLGFVSPVILTGRLIQRAVLQPNDHGQSANEIDWDGPIPDQYIDQWNDWKTSLKSITGLKIQRCFHPTDFGTPDSLELHVFSDASLHATGYVIYIRYQKQNHNHVSLVMANSRVTPRLANTVPRLELCAALDASIAAKETAKALSINHNNIFLHTDSTVVLGYITNTERRFSGYVTRRINMILKNFQKEQWSYVSSDNNPADIASRPQSVTSLLDSCWFNGPEFLWLNNENKATTPQQEASILPETITEVKNLLSHNSTTIPNVISTLVEKFDNWDKVVRFAVLAVSCSMYLIDRWNQKRGIQLAPRKIATNEQAEHTLIRFTQAQAFPITLKTLQHNQQLPHNDPLISYAPFLCSDGLIRVGGRLRHSPLPQTQKFPIILPTKHKITTLILRKCHNKIRHQGRILTQGAVRDEGYFIHQGSKEVDRFLKECVTCQRLRGPFLNQLMSDLPPDRLERTPPFMNTGMDVFGPYMVKYGTTTRRNTGTRKMWAIVFTCLVSRAVHIEPLPALDISAFKNAFRRFTCLRGQPKILRSDRGTNFVGASNQNEQLDLEQIENEFKDQKVKWIFNPPRAPHFGGVFERKIGSIKRIIDACMLQLGPNRVLTDDELYTFLAEATSIINNTPLTAISSDPNDPTPISPATILLQREAVDPVPLDTMTQTDLLSYGSRRWRRVQYLASQFWQRWRQEYLQTLTTRKKWQIPRRSLEPGDVVLIRDLTTTRNRWPLGKIKSVKTSKDGFVRSVTLNLPRKGDNRERTCVRPITELILLLKASD